ncbi:MAG: hypothetical protein ACOY94_25570 [Bacillota bacterium]
MREKLLSRGAASQVATELDRDPSPEQTRDRRRLLLAMLARAVSFSEVEQAVRRLRPQVDRTN